MVPPYEGKRLWTRKLESPSTVGNYMEWGLIVLINMYGIKL